MSDYLQLLRQRPFFRNLWLASVVSMAGDWFNVIATVILVNRYTDSGTAVGALFLARSLPPFLLGPVVGVVADRFNRKTILIVTDLLRAAIVLGFLLVNSAEQAWLIYLLTIAQFVVSAFFEPARAAILPSVVESDEELVLANTLSSATWSAMLMLGAALGGVMAALFGVQVALIIDAATFVLSAVLVVPITAVSAPSPTSGSHSSGWQDFLAGVAYLQQHPRVGLLSLVKGLGQLGAPDIMIALYAAHVFPTGNDGALALGLLFAFAGLGAVLGPIIANWFSKGAPRALQQAIGIGFVVIAGGWLLFGLAPTLPIALLAMTVRHVGGSTNWTYSTILLQMKVPDHYLGRVFAFDFAIFTLAASLSVWLTGVATDQLALAPRSIAVWLALFSFLPAVPWVVANWQVYVRE